MLASSCLLASALAAQTDPLVLHLPLDGKLAPAVGPPPRQSTAPEQAWTALDGRQGARLSQTSALWRAMDVLDNAQGAVSFFIRGDGQDGVLAEVRTFHTGGGEWTLRVHQKPYQPKEDEELPPPALLEVELHAVIFPNMGGGTVAQPAGATLRLQETGKWHHVVWTWRSVNHSLYIDGKRAGGASLYSRMMPMSSENGNFEIRRGGRGIVSDFRIYRRALETDDAATLATATLQQHLPEMQPMRVWADWGLLTGRAVVYVDVAGLPELPERVEFNCVNPEGRTIYTGVLDNFPSGLGEKVFQITADKPFDTGVHYIQAAAYDADGRVVAGARTADWDAPDFNRGFDLPSEQIKTNADAESIRAWIGSDAGLQNPDMILPPYEPISVEGNVLNVSRRSHTIDRSGMFSSIKADGVELLDAPVALRITSGGEHLDFAGGPGAAAVDNRGHEADWSAQTRTADGHVMSVSAHMEYDGVTRFDLTIEPNGELPVDRAVLVVPYREETLRLIHAPATGFINRFMAVDRDDDGNYSTRHIYWSTGAPKEPKRRENVIFDTNDLHHQDGAYKFTPFVHAGNFERGLSWFVVNDAGWIHNVPATPTMELEATPQARELQLNVIARPVTLIQPFKIRFYLIANPFKPLPEDWRTWVFHYSTPDRFTQQSKNIFWWRWNEYAESFRPFPRNFSEMLGRFNEMKVKQCPFTNFNVGSGSGLYGLSNEMFTQPYTWKLHQNRPLQDWFCYWIDRSIREIGIGGIYIDEIYTHHHSYNVLADDAAYIRDDGTRGMGFNYMQGRQYLRRLKHVLRENGIDHGVWLHTSSWKIAPMLTFTDIAMDGEFPAIWVPEFSDYHSFYNWERSEGYISSLPWGVVGTQMFNGNFNPNRWPETWLQTRTYLAGARPADVIPVQDTGVVNESRRINNALYNFGAHKLEGIETLRTEYLKDTFTGSTTQPEGVRFSGLLNRETGNVLLYAVAPSGKGTKFTLPNGFAGLKTIDTEHVHAWNAENGVSLNIDGKTVIEHYPGDLRVLWLKPADTPQAPRPDGVLLGVSFANGCEPDFGGGLFPAAFSNEETPAIENGRNGRALVIGGGQSTVAYPTIPSWIGGTLQIEIRFDEVTNQPLRVFKLDRHVAAELSVMRRDGKPLLILTVSESDYDASATHRHRSPEVTAREVVVNLPEDRLGEWMNITLAWRHGEYRLYIDDELSGTYSEPVCAKLQDTQAGAPGFWLGDDSARVQDAKALIDTVYLYDWAFDDSHVKAAIRQNDAPLSRPAPDTTSLYNVWAKGNVIHAAIDVRNHQEWETIDTVAIEVRTGQIADEKPAASGQIKPWLGTGTTRLEITEPPAAAGEETKADAEQEELEGLLGDLVQDEKPERTVTIKVIRNKEVISTHSVTLDKDTGRWQGRF